MIKPNNKVVTYGRNGLMFDKAGDKRPSVQDTGDGEFILYGVDGYKVIHKDDIDDLIILLQEVKAHGYKIDY